MQIVRVSILSCLVAALILGVGSPPAAAAQPPEITLRYEGLGTLELEVHADLADGRSFEVPVSLFCQIPGQEPWPVCLFAFYHVIPVDGQWLQASGGGTFSRDGTPYDVVVDHAGAAGAAGAARCEGNTTCTTEGAAWSPICPAGLASAHFFPVAYHEDDNVIEYRATGTTAGALCPPA